MTEIIQRYNYYFRFGALILVSSTDALITIFISKQMLPLFLGKHRGHLINDKRMNIKFFHLETKIISEIFIQFCFYGLSIRQYFY